MKLESKKDAKTGRFKMVEIAGSEYEVEENGFEYVKDNFEYSILEHHDDSTDRQHLIDRESYF